MDLSTQFPSRPEGAVPPSDPRLRPTPDYASTEYGTLGPGSDVAGLGASAQPAAGRNTAPRLVRLLTIAIGVIAALVAGEVRRSHSLDPQSWRTSQHEPAKAGDLVRLDRMKPQKQAETLLELAVGHSDSAVQQISSRVDGWQGKVQWNSQIANLTTAALNSNDMQVRQSGVEVELAAYGLAKNTKSLEYLLRSAESDDHAQKIWALWALGLMANRGVEAGRIVEVLTAHLKDADVDSRRWAVEGLALSGTDLAIEPLLKTMHDDASAVVRERAACSLAESGLFTSEQRMTAVPQLLNFADDGSVDTQTHGWAFQALRDITHQQLPSDAVAWRRWYESR